MDNKKRVIVWRTTQTCNMKCLFCSYSSGVKRQRKDADEAEVSRLIKILGEYRKETKENLLISWIGGEPFLWKPMLEFTKELKHYGIEVSTTTNGLLLSLENVRLEVIKYFSEIVISLDGFALCDDRVRQYEGHFKTVTENIAALDRERKAIGSGLKIKVNTILMRENIEQFEEFCNLLADLGVDEVTFNQLGGYDRPEFFEDNRLQSWQIKKLIEKMPALKEKFSLKGLIIHGGEDYLQRIMLSTENQKISIEECNPGSWFWFINEYGYISPCSYTSYEYIYDIKEIIGPADINNAEEYFRQVRKSNRSKWCNDCYCTQVYDKFE